MGDGYHNDIIAALAERTIKRLWILIIILIVYCGTMTYLYVDSIMSYETQEATAEVDTGEGDAYVAGIGDVTYGESQDKGENPQA